VVLVQLLAMFGLLLMVLVTAVSLGIAWNGDEQVSFVELPMFQPLMWISVGIFTGLEPMQPGEEATRVLTRCFAVDCSCQHGAVRTLLDC